MSQVSRRGGRWLAGLAVVALAVAGGWWAGRATLTESTPTTETATEQVLAVVKPASVGRTYSFNVTVKQPLSLVAANSLSGVVTFVSGGGEVKPGDIVYSVAGVPVRVAQGAVPFYRPLTEGAKGQDVRQVQAMLAALGYRIAADGEWGPRTTQVVKKWQKDLGGAETGTINLGELMAVQQLPATVALGKNIKLGHIVSGGEDGLLARFSEPEFVLNLSTDQAQLVPMDAAISITFADLVWEAVIAQTRTSESQYGSGGMEYVLTAPGGAPVCANACVRLPGDEQIQLRSRIQAVPQVSGLGVPAAAVRTDPGGETYVTMADGTRRPVKVVASGDGIAIVEGVSQGDKVVLPTGASSGGTSGQVPATPASPPPGSPPASPPASDTPPTPTGQG